MIEAPTEHALHQWADDGGPVPPEPHTPTAEPHAPPTDTDIEAAYKLCVRIARHRVRGIGQSVTEVAEDAAADAVVWAIAHYRPTNTNTFEAFARAATLRFVHRQIAQHARTHHSRPEHLPVRGDFDSGDDPGVVLAAPERDPADALALAELPADLRAAVELTIIHGYSQRETALLLGVSQSGVHLKLLRAAKLLGAAGGLSERTHATGTKRLRRA